MLLRGSVLFGVALALGSMGCDQKPAAGEAPHTARPPAAESGPDPLTLALASVSGANPDGRRIGALVEHARRHSQSDSSFLELGRAWVRYARTTSDPGYYLSANACAELILARTPTSLAAENLQGLVLLNQHQFVRARERAEAIVARDPRDPTAWGTLSDAALELGDFDAAVSAVGHMLEQKPGLPAYSRTAYLRWLRGDEDGALGAYRLAIDAGLDPGDPEPLAWVLVQTALVFFQRGDYAGADAGFAQALEVMRAYPPALVGRARVKLTAGDASGSAELLRQAYATSPLVETGALLVQALRAAGDTAGAERAYAAAEREGLRGDARSLSLLYSTLARNPERALELAQAERRVRGDLYTEDAVAWSAYRTGRFALARESIERARRLGTRDPRLLFHHGAILLAAGEMAGGRELLRQALAQSPKFEPEPAAEALRLLGGRT